MDEMLENWSETKSALLEGLAPEMSKIVAPLLENQKNYMLNETAAAGVTSAHDIANVRKTSIPLIRRIMPGVIATELVGVQPMSTPVTQVYSLRFKYGEDAVETNRPGFDGNPLIADDSITAGDEAFGNDPVLRAFYSGGAGALAVEAQVAGAGGMNEGAPIAIGSAVTSGEGWPSSLDAASTGPLGAAGPLYGGSGSFIEGSGGRKMSLELVSQAIEAKTRKLQAGWTMESMQDAASQHGLDVESEMTSALSSELT